MRARGSTLSLVDFLHCLVKFFTIKILGAESCVVSINFFYSIYGIWLFAFFMLEQNLKGENTNGGVKRI